MTKNQRAKLRAKFGGHCAYCGCVLGERWHADHVDPVLRKIAYVRGKGFQSTGEVWNPENEREDNLVPACVQCNLHKTTHSVEFWRSEIAAQIERLRKRSSGYRIANAFGLVSETGANVKFFFERYEAQP